MHVREREREVKRKKKKKAQKKTLRRDQDLKAQTLSPEQSVLSVRPLCPALLSIMTDSAININYFVSKRAGVFS